MAYHISPSTVESRAAILAPLKTGQAHAWLLATDNPAAARRFADRIREALRAAAAFPQRFPELAAAASRYTIRVISPSRVEAHPKGDPVRVASSGPARDYEPPVHGGETWGEPVPTVGLTSAQDLIASWRAHLPSNDPIHFPQTTLPYDELVKLYGWAQLNTPRLMLIVGESHITLSLHDTSVDEIAGWKPQPPRPQPDTLDV